MRFVDLRSDTVTLPTPAMRKAMYEAEVGDDVYGEDPTVNELEALAAQLLGKEAGLFVLSGTMGNQVAALTHTKRGNEVICEAESHIFYYELAGLACLSSAQPRVITGEHGILNAAIIKSSIRDEDLHYPRTGLICLENTHNRAGGTCYPKSVLAEIRQLAGQYNIPVHMDGARLFNAAVAQGASVSELAQYADSVTFCLSKGLAAPVGSVLVGSREFIDQARRYRKMLGGGTRQAGFLAAAGIVALNTMVDRLTEDHEHARLLAAAVANVGLGINLATVQTNIVVFDVAAINNTAAEFTAALLSFGIRASIFGATKVRMVTHYGITKEDILYTIDVIDQIVSSFK